VLVLLSFALVLVATVLLVLGLLNDDGLTLIYISIASSVAAAVVLMIALRLNKPRAGATAPTRAAPEPEPVAARATKSTTKVPAGTAAASTDDSDWLASDDEWGSNETWDDEDVDFPIADYDDLTVAQILPLLPQLYADEIGVVEAREKAGKARPAVLDKLAQLRRSSSADEPTQAVPATSGASSSDSFPIENYESLSAAQIRPLIGELDDEELALVREKEQSLGRRPSVLYEIDRRLGTAASPRASTRTATRATGRKAPTKATTAKKTAAKKAAPAKKASPAKKTAAKKAAPSTKAAPAKKTAAKKATATKKAAPAKKATKKS
jgi:hypothetical protein